MTIKEAILEAWIRPEAYYINKYIKYLRKEEYYLFNHPSKFLRYYYKSRKNRLGSRLGFVIHAGCIGENLLIGHYGSVIIHPRAKIGNNCIIRGNCCVGIRKDINEEVAVIGDNVDIGQYAQILGPVRIANNVKIGAGAVVISDVLEEGVTVVGVPARIVRADK